LYSSVAGIDPQLAASIIMHLAPTEQERMAKFISGKLKTEIGELLSYPEGSVGRIMTTDFLSFNKTVTVQEAIGRIRLLSKQKRIPASYAYVMDDDNRLTGVLNMRDMMIADPDQSLADIMIQNLFTVHCFMDKEDAAQELAKRRYFAVFKPLK
jgi:magnesium transporter